MEPIQTQSRRSWRSATHTCLLAACVFAAGCGGDGDDGANSGKRGTTAGRSGASVGRSGTTSTAGTASAGAGDGPSAVPAAAAAPPTLALHSVGRFDQPVDAVAVPQTDLIAVVEKPGRVRVVSGMRCTSATSCPPQPVTDGDVVLDLSAQVSTGSEQGLLGLAFHPDWPDDPRVFVDYTDRSGDTHIQAWTLPTATGRARRERELLRIDQPFPNHNGGHLAFGPDGLLYIGMGDGGSGGDPGDRAQDPEELLGKLLRLDVDRGGERGYAPARGNRAGGRPEVWALGLRNPWRFSFDSATGDLWIGDVGQDAFEEVDAIPRAELAADRTPLNLGWRRREGFSTYSTDGPRGPGEPVEPVLDYGRGDGCSITGGVVYRGRVVAGLQGWYVFADFCDTDLRLVRADGVPGSRQRRGALRWRTQRGAAQVASFAEVQGGEVLLVSLDGPIRQLVPGS